MLGELDLLTTPLYASLILETYTSSTDVVDMTKLNPVATSTLQNKRVGNTFFGASPITFEESPRGSIVKCILIHSDTIPIVLLSEASYGLPFTTNGGPITLSWGKDKTKIFKL